ncbi:amino acid ABC transporter substrate-binding protein [Longirhabdus pacifica]|uniref:amino acid ABC transporter substrate-binding protein n=1 Tax=Longirhabdus pacifica TaxID=2305227 RepID=UPI00100912FE|nr:amino acid ABC transporter substrate-binding protein [Longirhabdus pacifica]
MKRIIMLSAIILLFGSLFVGCSDSSSSEESSLLSQIKERGHINAGINGTLPGFGYLESNNDFVGFDVDFAHAVAAAVFGDASKVEFQELTAAERFTAVQTGNVDLLSRNTTVTTTRDVDLGLNFAPVTFYDGQGMMVHADSGITSLEDLDGKRIAVEQGTTTEKNLADVMNELGISYEAVTFDGDDAAVAAYQQKSVDAWTTDKSGLVARQSVMQDPSAHKILPETMSKEPLAMGVIGHDEQWYDIVKWVVNATIQAEEFGMNSQNIDEFLDSDSPRIKSFLGVEGNFGEQLGLPKDFAYQVIKQVGNYGEIFDRHLGEGGMGLERGYNDLYTNGGLLYSPPFN